MWALFFGIGGVISQCLLLFPVDILRHGISFTHIASAEKDPVTCLGTTLEFPEVAADILQQTDFSLELPPQNRSTALTLPDWSSQSSRRGAPRKHAGMRTLTRHVYFRCLLQQALDKTDRHFHLFCPPCV